MTTIRCIYASEPDFPATDQAPDAVRYQVGNYWVDAAGGAPTLDEVNAVLAPPQPNLQPFQFRAMLSLSGNAGALDAYIASLPDPQKTISQAKLDYSLSFERHNELVLAAQQALGLTDAQLDALWAQAAAIT
jgi:hypothetical protein